MASLQPMPPVSIPPIALQPFGAEWQSLDNKLGRQPPHSSADLAALFDRAVAASVATFLGGVPIVNLGPNNGKLKPDQPDSVETGHVLVVGGVRTQNFDVVYRPDGVRFAFDSKTLNDRASIKKNWRNMINDLATEATTVHSRFPHAVVAFLVAYPRPCIEPEELNATIETLERLARRTGVDDPVYTAEAVTFVLWDPVSGEIDPHLPSYNSPLRIEAFSAPIQQAYTSRYKGLPPHAV